jgi:alpha-methylacyl-CoA racemase
VKRDLEGVTLLDFGGVGPVARGVRVLSDLGVRWIQIAAPASAARHAPPWHSYGALRGAEQVELDLKDPASRDAALRIAAKVDIVLESFRPGVAKRLGIDYSAIKAKNPRLIYCALTGYGQTGPYAGWAGHDLNYQAVAGALFAQGRDKDGVPALPALTLADSAGGGWLAVIRILAALHSRASTNQGQFIDASAIEGVLHLNSMTIDEYLVTGKEEGTGGGMVNGGFAGYAVYKCADGKFITCGAIEPKFFRTLVETLGLPQLAARQLDPAAQDEMRRQIAAAFAKKSRDEWTKIFAKLDACIAPVLTPAEIVSDPHWVANNAVVEYQHPTEGRQRQVKPFGPPGTERGAPPKKGQGKALLKEFGLSEAEIAALKI